MRYFIFIILLALSIQANEQLELYVFHAMDCDNCQYIKKNIFPKIDKKYQGQLNYHWFDVDSSDNYEILTQVEEHFQKFGSEYPIIVFADTILGSKEEIEPYYDSMIQKKLEEGYYSLRDSSLITIFNRDSKKESKEQIESKPISIVYFNKPKCSHCDRVEKCLAYIKKKYPQVVINKFSEMDQDNKLLLKSFDELYNVPDENHLGTPAIFIGEFAYVDDKATDQKIIRAVETYLQTGVEDKIALARNNMVSASDEIVSDFKNLGIFAIISMGLLDGINPCAFTTIIFFISYLSFLGRKKKEMIIVGTFYTTAVFLTYFLIGLGLLQFLVYLKIFEIISQVIIGVTGVIAIGFAVVSIYNFFKVKKGQERDIALQLPTKMKKRIHETIRTYSKASHLMVGAFVIGFFVSIFELACTGQVYLPTITFMVHHPDYHNKAFLLLFLYNFMFIVPLIVIFFLAYKGLTSEQLSKYWRKELGYIELAIALFFLFIGTVLIYLAFF